MHLIASLVVSACSYQHTLDPSATDDSRLYLRAITQIQCDSAYEYALLSRAYDALQMQTQAMDALTTAIKHAHDSGDSSDWLLIFDVALEQGHDALAQECASNCGEYRQACEEGIVLHRIREGARCEIPLLLERTPQRLLTTLLVCHALVSQGDAEEALRLSLDDQLPEAETHILRRRVARQVIDTWLAEGRIEKASDLVAKLETIPANFRDAWDLKILKATMDESPRSSLLALSKELSRVDPKNSSGLYFNILQETSKRGWVDATKLIVASIDDDALAGSELVYIAKSLAANRDIEQLKALFEDTPTSKQEIQIGLLLANHHLQSGNDVECIETLDKLSERINDAPLGYRLQRTELIRAYSRIGRAEAAIKLTNTGNKSTKLSLLIEAIRAQTHKR